MNIKIVLPGYIKIIPCRIKVFKYYKLQLINKQKLIYNLPI